MVGIPGRVIGRPVSEQEKNRQEMAEKIGFQAYGVSNDMPDPVAEAIGALLDHMHAVDGKLDRVCDNLKRQGIQGCDEKLPELNAEDFEPVKARGGTD